MYICTLSGLGHIYISGEGTIKRIMILVHCVFLPDIFYEYQLTNVFHFLRSLKGANTKTNLGKLYISESAVALSM